MKSRAGCTYNKGKKVVLFEDYALIPLTKGCYAKVDLADATLLSERNWTVRLRNRGSYAFNSYGVPMHRFILGLTDPTIFVDHIDGDGLNNRRANLRICNRVQNSSNKRKTETLTTSRYQGVSWVDTKGKWRASVTYNHKVFYLGLFQCEHCAALAYDNKAKELRGEFANPNFPVDGTEHKATLQ